MKSRHRHGLEVVLVNFLSTKSMTSIVPSNLMLRSKFGIQLSSHVPKNGLESEGML